MRKIRRSVIIVCLVLLATLNLVYASEAASGLLDLREEQEALIPLETQWEFYWEMLLEPGDFEAGAPEPSGFVQVPGAWNGYRLEGETLPGQGYATYRVQVLMDPDRITAFKMPRILTAYRMWVDGKEVVSAGTVGTSPEESNPQYLTQQAFVTPEQEQVDIVIQVSNFHHRSGGMLENILVGSSDQVLSVTKNRLAYELFLFGSLLVMGVYHLVLFKYREKERSLFYFAIYCLMIATRTLFVGEVFMIQLFPAFPWELAHKLQTLSYYLAVLILLLFFREMYRRYVAAMVVKASTVVVGIFAAVVLLRPARIFTLVNPVFQVFTILLSLYVFLVLFRICRNKEAGARFIAFGYGFLIFTVLHDLAFHSILMSDYRLLTSLIRSGNLSSFGLLVFTLTHSFVLAIKYAHTFNKNEEMTAELLHLNENLETLVEKRTEDLMASHEKIEEQKQDLERTNRKLELMSQKDGLTNVWNRRRFDEVLAFEWQRALRFQHRLSLLFLDIDDFKIFNDEQGHQAGDKCLQQVAEVLQTHVKRSVDVVARYGGEEFVVLLSETDLRGTGVIAETLRAGVEDLGVTVSIGVATMVPTADLSPEELISAADQAMYQAKKKGKNRVEQHVAHQGQ